MIHYRTSDGKMRMERYDDRGQLSYVRIQAADGTVPDLDPVSKHATPVAGAKEAPAPPPAAGDPADVRLPGRLDTGDA